MTWTKYNNPNKKRRRKKMDRSDADVVAASYMIKDRQAGINLPLSHYDKISDNLCGKESRGLYD